jgi:O-antigen ligase
MFTLLIAACVTTVFSTALMQILVVLLTAASVTCFLITRPFVWRRTALDIPYGTFVLARLLSVAFSTDPSRSLPALHIEFFFYVVFYLATQTRMLGEESSARLIVNVLIGSAVIASIVGLTQVLCFGESRAVSTTAGTYTLGGFLLAVLPLALLLPAGKGGGRWSSWIIVTVICLGITFTYDRLHWFGMGLVILFGGLIFRRRFLVVSVIAAACVIWLSPPVQVRLAQTFHLNEYASGHDVLWRGAWQLIGNHPLTGFGPRTFTEIFPLFDQLPIRGVGSWHNDYLQVYMESGLLGLLPLLWCIGTVYFAGARWLRSGEGDPERRTFLVALLLSLTVVFLLGGIIDTHVGIIFRVILALFALQVSPDTSPGFRKETR